MKNGTIVEYLIFVIFCVKKIKADRFIVSNFKVHWKLFLKVASIRPTFESNSKR